MQRIDTPTAAADLFGPGKAGFTDGNVYTGMPATALNAAWFNNIQEELCKIVEAAGLIPDPDDRTQVYQALQLIFAQHSDPVEPPVPAGAVAHFARSSAPIGWLKCNGAAVNRATYADLFAAIGTTFGGGDGATTFNVPDLRGEFVRGWDDGRGVDSGRGFGTAQADELRSHSHQFRSGADSEAGTNDESNSTDLGNWQDGWIGYTGGNETRPRNIALLACIKY